MVVGDRPLGGGATPIGHPGDLLRVVVGRITPITSGVAARGGKPGRVEVNLLRLITDLPDMLAGRP